MQQRGRCSLSRQCRHPDAMPQVGAFSRSHQSLRPLQVSCHGCGRGIRAETGHRGRTRGSVGVQCTGCHRRVCADCGRLWNRLHSCELAEDLASERDKRLASLEFEAFASELGLKRCPNCGSGCEKADPDSCDHMTCLHCGHEFCWTCLADRNVILHHGNHYHKPGCRFNFGPGPVEFMSRCSKCRESGKPCQPPGAESSSNTLMLRKKSPAVVSRASRWDKAAAAAAPAALPTKGVPFADLFGSEVLDLSLSDSHSSCLESYFLDRRGGHRRNRDERGGGIDLDASHVEAKLCSTCPVHTCPGHQWISTALMSLSFFKPQTRQSQDGSLSLPRQSPSSGRYL
mmetsp:Transcript_10053/g.22589  ORF Transcript_10053/g.22589 Transcript_10053/m.22589 type:complete len:343 (+) Transcript_10053:128-1156(+)